MVHRPYSLWPSVPTMQSSLWLADTKGLHCGIVEFTQKQPASTATLPYLSLSLTLKLLPSPLGHVIIRASGQITSCFPNRYFPDSSSVEITAPRVTTNSPKGKWTVMNNNPWFHHLPHLLKIPRLRLRWPGTSINLLRVLRISSLSLLSKPLIMRLKSNGLTRPLRCD